MPAQKLTPARLFHLVVVLLVLSTAFFWRTFNNPSHSQPILVSCQVSQTCHFQYQNTKGELIALPKSQWQLVLSEPSVSDRVTWQVKAQKAKQVQQLDMHRWRIHGENTEAIIILADQQPVVRLTFHP